MSVLSLIQRGRQAAKQHTAEQAEQKKKEAVKVPYKHVVTHAATDAMSGAPQTWRQDDRPKIIEQNRRRSAMAGTGMGFSGPTHPGIPVPLPRVGSSLSHVSYPA